MKIIPESNIQTLNPVKVIELQKEVHQTTKLVGKLTLKPGMILFQLNIKTGEIKPATLTYQDYVIGKNARKLVGDNDHIYLPALNEKNFIRKLKQQKYII